MKHDDYYKSTTEEGKLIALITFPSSSEYHRKQAFQLATGEFEQRDAKGRVARWRGGDLITVWQSAEPRRRDKAQLQRSNVVPLASRR